MHILEARGVCTVLMDYILCVDAGVSPLNIDQVIFINTGTTVQQLCLDDVQLLDGIAV